MKRNSSYIERIARIILAEDDYDYIYDPEHKQRPPSGYFETEHGWSTYKENSQQIKDEDKNLTIPQKQVKSISPYYEREVLEYELSGDERILEKIQRMVIWSAKKMGYDLIAYHGSNIQDIERFEPRMSDAIFVAQERKEAFAQARRREGTTKIYPLAVNSQNLFDYRDPKNRKIIKPWVWDVKSYEGHYDALESHSNEIRAMGYDGFYVTEGKDTYEKPNIAIFEPWKIKSIEPIAYRNRKMIPITERFNPLNDSLYGGPS